MSLNEALALFSRLGVNVTAISRQQFSAEYYRLVRLYHPDLGTYTHDLMANINAARTTILKSYIVG